MIKKIALLLLLVSNLLSFEDDNESLPKAEIDQTGIFMGIGLSSLEYSVTQDGFGNNLQNYNKSIEDQNDFAASFLLGYRYYFTRIYARVSTFKYKQDEIKYTIDGQLIEMNVEYTPIFYRSSENDFNIRGIFGMGVGVNNSTISHVYSQAEYVTDIINSDKTQMFMEYGYQIGALLETSTGFSFDILLRSRWGTLLEYEEAGERLTFVNDTKELYIGVNYLF